MTTEDRVKRLETAFVSVVEMLRHHEERLDDSDQRQKDFEQRMAGLIEAQKQTSADISALAVIAGDTDKRLDRVSERLDRVGERLDQMTVRLDQVTVRLDQVTVRLDQVTVRLDRLAELFERHMAEHHSAA